MKALVLANGAAGRGHNRGRLERVRRVCAEAGVELVHTASPEETRERSRQAGLDGCERVIAAGGDGTAHHVLNGLAGTGAALGLIPLGSGNDLARNLGIPLDVEAAARFAFGGPVRRIDLARICGSLFASVASLGLNAFANRIANRHRRLRGGLIYTYALLRSLLEYRVASVTIESDGGNFQGRMMVTAAANCRSFGGGMRIAPQADLTDGQADLCIVREMSRLKLLRCFPEVFFGTHLRHREVSYFRITRARLDADRPLDVFADGEFVGQTPTDLEVCPGALAVVAAPLAGKFQV